MKIHAKSFLSGIIVTVLVMSTPLVFAATQKTIDAIFGQVKLIVNGSPVDKETLLYEGRTYLPLRDTAEALGMEVTWDETTSTATLTGANATDQPPAAIPAPPAAAIPGEDPAMPADSPKYDRSNPASIYTTIGLTQYIDTEEYVIDIRLNSVIRGTDAWEMVRSANRLNKAPESGYEYLIANVFVNVKESNTNKSLRVDPWDFHIYSSDLKEYDNWLSSITMPKPELSYDLKEDDAEAGYLVYLVKIGDKPLLQYGGDAEGTGGVWYKLYDYN